MRINVLYLVCSINKSAYICITKVNERFTTAKIKIKL